MLPGRMTVLLFSLLGSACSSLPPDEDVETTATEPLSPEQASQIYVEKGVQYMAAGRYEIALQDMQRGVELDDENSEAYNALGVLYQELGDPAQADSHFRQALNLKPDNFGARNNYGRFLCSRRRVDEAFEQFAMVINTKLYGQPWIPLTNAGVCARSIGRRPQAESYLRRALEAEPRFPPALLEMAKLSRETGQSMVARGFLERYLIANGPTPEALMLGIEIEMGLGNQPAAAQYLQTLRDRFPDAPEVMRVRQKPLP